MRSPGPSATTTASAAKTGSARIRRVGRKWNQTISPARIRKLIKKSTTETNTDAAGTITRGK